MKNRFNYVAAAEATVQAYRKSSKFYLESSERWVNFVRKNSRGEKAVRLAGYLTGQGIWKSKK